MPIASIVAWLLTNPQIVAAGEGVVQDLVNFVKGALVLHKVGVLSDEQLAAIWAQVGVDTDKAVAAWDAALVAHRAAQAP